MERQSSRPLHSPIYEPLLVLRPPCSKGLGSFVTLHSSSWPPTAACPPSSRASSGWFNSSAMGAVGQPQSSGATDLQIQTLATSFQGNKDHMHCGVLPECPQHGLPHGDGERTHQHHGLDASLLQPPLHNVQHVGKLGAMTSANGNAEVERSRGPPHHRLKTVKKGAFIATTFVREKGVAA